jgi:hypothetical protein
MGHDFPEELQEQAAVAAAAQNRENSRTWLIVVNF